MTGVTHTIRERTKKLGKVFRPHEAKKAGEKLAKVMGGTGRAMPFFAVALDFYCQYQDEKAEAEQEKQLARARHALHKAFHEQAENEARSLEEAVGQISEGPIREAVTELQAEAEAITAADTEREALLNELRELKKRCNSLWSQL